MLGAKNRLLIALVYALSPLATAFIVSVSAAPEPVWFIMAYAVLLFSIPAFIVGWIQTAVLHRSRLFRMAVSGVSAFALCLVFSVCFNPLESGQSFTDSFGDLGRPPLPHLYLGIYGVLTAWLLDFLITAALNRKAV
ncbi:hypothetical protein [Neisseria musculi]|uniref:Membrane protein n=1 Tax=Neisseria musculi TaxID=1815583 RepID=A0A7H1MBW9_9NEIS|nr:hypothetical protein [Neisseria musculi]QNT59134.1 putative membrane protein [Neisseria musculi]